MTLVQSWLLLVLRELSTVGSPWEDDAETGWGLRWCSYMVQRFRGFLFSCGSATGGRRREIGGGRRVRREEGGGVGKEVSTAPRDK